MAYVALLLPGRELVMENCVVSYVESIGILRRASA